MSSIFLFDIASQRNHWLSVRQATVAGNIANANTPGYTAVDVLPFEAVLQSSRLEMATSAPGHLAQPDARLSGLTEPHDDGWHVTNSGNSVNLEKEMVKAGEVNGAFALSNGVIKAFHRMLMTSTKG